MTKANVYSHAAFDPHTAFHIQQKFTVSFDYPVIFTRDAFSPDNQGLAKLIDNLDEQPKILPVIDSEVDKCHPLLTEQIESYFDSIDIEVLPYIVIDGGEACKNDPQLTDTIYAAVEEHAIDRHSYILVIGGGAVVDAVGYAAATAHRGIRLIRMPSTVLGQNDAGVGVKNAINYHKRKNYLGTFVPPHAVVNDFSLLQTLSVRDKRAGIAEAIKVALIKDSHFFDELYQQRNALALFENSAMENMIIKGAKWHLNHIATNGDPFEYGSARPLDFGHWSAHKLEELSNSDLRHGEAVAIGIAMDSIYSHKAGHLAEQDMRKILDLLIELGFDLQHPALAKLNVEQALNEFKEHLGGRLCITLLSELGTGFEVNTIDSQMMCESIAYLTDYIT
ncbi:3-dehydroquinate synthase [Saccharobesus litoralis]|uniref:3-dehydroquinate synthase n=1 Tax=Saccharobesus litoralis TaxID=2172099 RepID=A0A2S0VT74_9ALTE|nr:3-dehydroquinate synthase [Saccharobesus litoralis]AWB67415.1 3-dehydroquinate synthase [Saccharobesus litoralis]